jgi:hypothetical protein
MVIDELINFGCEDPILSTITASIIGGTATGITAVIACYLSNKMGFNMLEYSNYNSFKKMIITKTIAGAIFAGAMTYGWITTTKDNKQNEPDNSINQHIAPIERIKPLNSHESLNTYKISFPRELSYKIYF